MSAIKMYTTAVCPYCTQAKTLLAKYDIKPEEIEEIRVDTDPEGRAKMMALTGQRTVPQIYIGETHVGGYDALAKLEKEGKLKAMLDA